MTNPISPNTKLAHYTIISRIGAGGMGEVYLAEDTRLHRKVALKILPADLASNKDRMRRFEQEAQAAAALNHPNIATIHEIGADEGVHFIAMEFIDGVMLRELIHRQQPDLPKLLRHLQHVKIKLSGGDEQKITKSSTKNAEAYRLYLLGRFYANKRTPKDSRKAIEYFQQAVSNDPNYALAYVGLAVSYIYLTIYGDDPASETFPKAREFSLKAIELDNTMAGPHITLGLLKFLQDHDLAGWERECASRPFYNESACHNNKPAKMKRCPH